MYVVVVHTVDSDGTNYITIHGSMRDPAKAQACANKFERYLAKEHRNEFTSVAVRRVQRPTIPEMDGYH